VAAGAVEGSGDRARSHDGGIGSTAANAVIGA
jgi:hypothetical protein